MNEIKQLIEAMTVLEAQRSILGDVVVDAALAPMQEKLTELKAHAQQIQQQRKQITVLFADISAVAIGLIVPLMLFQGIVCSSEEIIFRGGIFRHLMNLHWAVAYFAASAIFAVFHWAAYGGNLMSMLIAFLMSLLLCYLTEKYNIGYSMAVHYFYNLAVLGVVLLWPFLVANS